jgi:hypothetical protein
VRQGGDPYAKCGIGLTQITAIHRPSSPFVTESTLERGAEVSVAASLGLRPFTDLPRRFMPDVLRVATLKVGYPLALAIAMKSGNALFHFSGKVVSLGSSAGAGQTLCWPTQ